MRLIGLVGAKGSGKSTAAKLLNAQCNYHTMSMATPIRNMLLSLGITPRQLHEDKEEIIPAFGMTGRHMLQTLGTEWGRKIDPDIWVKAMKLEINASPWDICIDDVRFDNEADMIHWFGGQLVYIKRSSVETQEDEHESERYYKELPYDSVVVNNGNIADLHTKLMQILKK